ncbi:MAG: DUF4347 domain-containing protein, partial [Pelodictyon phaeoclathratiforme]
MIFIDSRAKDSNTLISKFQADAEYFILNANRDGLQQVTERLAGTSGQYDSIQIISHGSSGAITIGSTILSNTTLDTYQQELVIIGNSLQANGDLLLYGCNVGSGEAGKQFVETLAQMTGADVAASDDVTGSAVFGGDWVLENTIGMVDAFQIFADDSAENYAYTLMDISGQSTRYSSARDHLNQLIAIDFGTISADDFSAITSLQSVVLSKINFFDGRINIYDFLFDIERMSQIQDEMYLAKTDIEALFSYMSAADYSYYEVMMSRESSLQSQVYGIMRDAKPGLLDYFIVNSAQAWEGISGVITALYEAIVSSAGGLKGILESKGKALSDIIPSEYDYLANGAGLELVQIGEFSQFIFTFMRNVDELVNNFAAFFTVPTSRQQLSTDNLFLVLEMADSLSSWLDSFGNLLPSGAKIILDFTEIVDSIRDIISISSDIKFISAAVESASLSDLAKEFLDDALWIKSLEGVDAVKDVINILLSFLHNPPLQGLVAYWSEAVVTITDMLAISGKTEWRLLVDEFDAYGQLVSVVDSYQSSISSWLNHADELSEGSWGQNIASELPSEPFPATDVFSDHYDGLLENVPFESGGILSVGSSYSGAITVGDPGDWFVVTLQVGKDYRFQLTEGTISSADIMLYDARSRLIANPDASLSNSTTSVIQGTSLESGTYYVVVDNIGYSGSYTIILTEVTPMASLTEFGDAPGTPSTPYHLEVAETFRGNMNSDDNDTSEDDWIEVTLEAGKDYRFELTRGTISSAAIKLYDAMGKLFANPDGSLSTGIT